jgi:hypothetical protein
MPQPAEPWPLSVVGMLKAREARGSLSASPTPRDNSPPPLIRRTFMNKEVVQSQHTVTVYTKEMLRQHLQAARSNTPTSRGSSPLRQHLQAVRSNTPTSRGSDASVSNWLITEQLNVPLPEQAGRHKNGLDEFQDGLTNLLGNFFHVPSVPEDDACSKDNELLLSAIVFGPDSPSPRLVSQVQQGTRHAPAMNAATLHHSATTTVRLPKSAQRIPSVQVPPAGPSPSGQDTPQQSGWLLKAEHAAEKARTISAHGGRRGETSS